MDYSSLPNDPDHPSGTSPWSSPQPTSRQSFTGSEPASTPSSVLARHSPYQNISQLHSEDGSDNEPSETENRKTDENDTVAPSENGTSSEAQRSQFSNELAREQQHQNQQYRQQNQRGVGPNRYHGINRPGQRQNPPQYKLQAKISGLERTGRKDPILRFDVHVCFKHLSLM